MNKLTATFRIVTPMFIAGADQKKAELRAPSIKGALRFWWRTLNWSRIHQTSRDEDSALDELKKQEGLLFGDAGKAGGSKILINLNKRLTGTLSGNSLLNPDNARKYLGYGLFTMGEHNERKAIPENKTFDLEILSKENIDQELRRQLEESIRGLGLLGGLGSRSSNGFGSLAIEKCGDQSLNYDSLDQYKTALSDLSQIDTLADAQPPFTAFSRQSRVIFGPLKTSPELAHRYIGGLYKGYRTTQTHEPRKKYFGLPLDGYDTNNRRSSPLFFHVHPIVNQFVPVMIYMPTTFHPDYSAEDYSLVESFIDFFKEESQ